MPGGLSGSLLTGGVTRSLLPSRLARSLLTSGLPGTLVTRSLTGSLSRRLLTGLAGRVLTTLTGGGLTWRLLTGGLGPGVLSRLTRGRSTGGGACRIGALPVQSTRGVAASLGLCTRWSCSRLRGLTLLTGLGCRSVLLLRSLTCVPGLTCLLTGRSCRCCTRLTLMCGPAVVVATLRRSGLPGVGILPTKTS